jgi:L-fuconolactonase
LIYPNHLKYAEQLVAEFPNQRFVIDHIAKANIRDKKIEEWKSDLQAIAKHSNVHCKVSGMLTEADWHAWLTADFRPYLDVVFHTFGTGRLMYGSDWPVCLLAGGYKRWIEIIEVYTSTLSQNEQDKFWGDNAVKFYDLKLS